ncbi:MAG: 16S rRNA (cytosine(967)-C(5))-methyltransferase RsmB [Oscillospiraceae bacterium]|nr:16S rRNA (cytosine(967)-C(5))-methyltransferase RsmB [Oscillospiraceae bacterium]
MSSGREAAMTSLTACRRLDAWSDGSLKAASRGLDRREAALAARLTYGVLQNRALLDFYLGHYCSQPFGKLEPFVRDVLRLGAYQILFMDRVPDSAAVNEAVKMVKDRRRQRAAGFVNAVLRRLSREKGRLPEIPADDEAGCLALRYSHPVWLVKRLLGLLGREETEAFLRLDNESVPTTIQRNTLRCTAPELTASLGESGAEPRPHPWMPDCWEITGGGDLEAMAAFQRGLFQVQDAAAKSAVLAAGLRPGMRVLDVCAAPGGKSFAAAMVMEDRGEIVACDIHPHKLGLIEKGARRLGLQCIRTVQADGREAREDWIGGFDLVLCDVPCSGLGIIRKKPDIRYKDPEQLAGLPAVQRAILENAAQYVRPGGVLLYATCTVLPEENGAVTADFLCRRSEFRKEPFPLPGLPEQNDGELALWPQRHGTDGFYVCKMRKL